MKYEHISSEAVGEGHPDKVADYISDAVLDACLEQDRNAHVACETLVKSNCVVLAGEISTTAQLNYEAIVRKAIRDIGYTDPKEDFNADSVFVINLLTAQSSEINDAVSKSAKEIGAGDQGFFFGYACDETPEYLPASYMLAQRLCHQLAKARKENQVSWLRPDCKALVTMLYEDNHPVEIENIVLATQHSTSISQEKIKSYCREQLIPEVVLGEWLSDKTAYYINSSGSFIHGGPSADSGLTGRKIIVDTYGGWAHHGGGAFSGKDPSKVDRSGAYFCRWVAKNIVAAELASRVEVRLAYTIGGTKPIHYDLTTYGTEKCDIEVLHKAISQVFDARPFSILEALDLKRPIYRQTTQFGHFTKAFLPWEQTNRVQELLSLCK